MASLAVRLIAFGWVMGVMGNSIDVYVFNVAFIVTCMDRLIALFHWKVLVEVKAKE